MHDEDENLDGDGSITEEDTDSENGDIDIKAEAEKWKATAESLKTRAEKAEQKLKSISKNNSFDPDAFMEQAEKAAERKLQERDLEELEYSDDIKEAIKNLAATKGISIRKASNDEYIQFLVSKEEKQARNDAAADNGSKTSKGGFTYDASKPLDVADFDMSTEEGRKAWDAAKEARRAKLAKS